MLCGRAKRAKAAEKTEKKEVISVSLSSLAARGAHRRPRVAAARGDDASAVKSKWPRALSNRRAEEKSDPMVVERSRAGDQRPPDSGLRLQESNVE